MSITAAQAKQLGTIIAKARARKGLSIRELASQLEVHASWVGFLEQGHYLDPAPDRLARIAELLDIEPRRIDRLTRGTMADSLPAVRAYFRTKYGLSPEQGDRMERYFKRYITPPSEPAA